MSDHVSGLPPRGGEPDGLESLLDCLRKERGPDRADRERVWAGIAAIITPPPLPSDGGGHGPDGSAPAPDPSSVPSPVDPGLAAGQTTAASAGASVTSVGGATAPAGLAGLTGLAGLAGLAKIAAVVALATAATMGTWRALAPSEKSSEPSSESRPIAVAPRAEPTATEPARPTPPVRDDALAAEHALLRRAQRALGADDAEQALEALATHDRRHPAGRLSEEREALRVRALLRVGRADDARAAADAFRRRFPQSLLWHSLEQALADPR